MKTLKEFKEEHGITALSESLPHAYKRTMQANSVADTRWRMSAINPGDKHLEKKAAASKELALKKRATHARETEKYRAQFAPTDAETAYNQRYPKGHVAGD